MIDAGRKRSTIARRGFLKRAVGVGIGSTALPLAAAAAVVSAAAPPEPSPGYLSLGRDEAAFVEALVTVMCPADALTPDGVSCGLAVFIDRQLAGDFGKGAKLYGHGPWQAGKPEHGYQLPMTPEQHFKAGIEVVDAVCEARYGKRFDRLSAAAADGFLVELAAGRVVDERVPMAAWFNELVYPLFAQGCYADPIYGGNADKVFWKLIGYPGLPATHTINVLRYRGLPFPGAAEPRSIADFA